MSNELAVIDIGSNTVHLLVGTVKHGFVVPERSETLALRLGQGVAETGRIAPEKLALAVSAVRLFAEMARTDGARRVVVVATSAVRDAKNGPELVERISTETHLDVRLLSGDEEARLGFRGAMSARRFRPNEEALVVDLGGGSAQLILGSARGGPERLASLLLGTNRMTERYLPSDPPTESQLRELHQAVLRMLPDWQLPGATKVLAVGGSARALANFAGEPLIRSQLPEIARQIAEQPSGVFARERGFDPTRARVLPAAAITLAGMLEHFGLPMLWVARTGLREGVLIEMTEAGEASEAAG